MLTRYMTHSEPAREPALHTYGLSSEREERLDGGCAVDGRGGQSESGHRCLLLQLAPHHG